MEIYKLIMIVILPSMMCTALNLFIFRYVRSSSHRVQAITHATHDEHTKNQSHRRDMHLLRHILIMFSVFIGGWAPAFILRCFVPNLAVRTLSMCLFMVLAELSLLVVMINLYVYNHELRQHLFNKIFKCQRA